MLKKRDIFRKCFDDFDFHQIAKYSEQDIIRIMNEEGMIRSRRKIEAIIGNAKAFLKIIEEYGSFDDYIWSYSNYESLIYVKHHNGQGEASNVLSDQISKDLKKRGFKFVGSTIVYAYMQAIGMVNDHVKGCYLYEPE